MDQPLRPPVSTICHDVHNFHLVQQSTTRDSSVFSQKAKLIIHCLPVVHPSCLSADLQTTRQALVTRTTDGRTDSQPLPAVDGPCDAQTSCRKHRCSCELSMCTSVQYLRPNQANYPPYMDFTECFQSPGAFLAGDTFGRNQVPADYGCTLAEMDQYRQQLSPRQNAS